ncbi:MAG TPA: DUF86 domain-containing protein [Bacillota bacterium]|nr:DUF86 domain-containing protein [Bacillota bacterium]
MYFVDQSKIEEVLVYIERLLQELPKHPYDSFLEKLALERMTHMIIESIIDVGNMMIDGFIMRDPGSYEDIIDILIDEKVIPSDEEKMYKEIIRLRNMLVKEYMQVDHKMLQNTVLEHKEVLDHFSAHIRTYLTNETGVANAFSNES